MQTQAEKVQQEKLKDKREKELQKKEMKINGYTDEQVTQELKNKGLPVFGTRTEKVERLKKAHGIQNNQKGVQVVKSEEKNEEKNEGKKGLPKSNVVHQIEQMEKKREERRLQMEKMKMEKVEKQQENIALGRNVDVEFDVMIQKQQLKPSEFKDYVSADKLKLSVCVRKRPLFQKEYKDGEIDALSIQNPKVRVLECKLKVDGITKYIENHDFTYDNIFDEHQKSESIYKYQIRPLLDLLFNDGVVTCFAYGQTGSGKTFTMQNIQEQTVKDIFKIINNNNQQNISCNVSFFEIYGGKCFDLLNNKNKINVMEDKYNNVQMQGMVEQQVKTREDLIKMIEYGNSIRTTHQTAANDTSSRSHAICQIMLRNEKMKEIGKLLLVDLAGSERAQDTQSNNRQRRLEGAEINKSLLALKECIRAMDQGASHLPFRASKLTLSLRNSFVSKGNKSRIVMIACVSPGSSSADHSLNTLRYANRLKDNSKVKEFGINNNVNNIDTHLTSTIQQPLLLPIVVDQKQSNVNQQYKMQQQVQSLQQKQQNQQNQQNQQGSNQNIQQKGTNSSSSQQKQQQQQQQQYQQQDDSDQSDQENKQQKLNQQEDMQHMKMTLKLDNEKVDEKFFDFQEKVTNILDDQEEVFAIHMAAIKEDAKLLTGESELISKAQGVGFMDYDIDNYVGTLEHIIKKKLKMYNLLNRKLMKLKNDLKEEEEVRKNVKGTFYY